MKGKMAESLLADELPNVEDLPDNWKWIQLGSIIESMKNGVYKEPKFYKNDGFPCLRMYNIEDGRIIWKNIKRMDLTTDEINTFLLRPNDILINRVNSRELVGKSALITEKIEPCVYESKNIRLRMKNDEANSQYVVYWLQVNAQKFFNLNSQQTVGMASINQDQIASMPIPLPPLAEQQRIVARVEALLTYVSAARDQLSRVPLIMKKFRQAVLATACSGRLTEGWRDKNPDVESAESALLRCSHISSTQKASKKIRRRGTVGMPEIDLPENLPNTWTIKKIKDLVEIGAIFDYQDGNHGELYPRTTDFGDDGIKFLTATQVFDNDVRLSEAPLLKNEKASHIRIGFAKPQDVLLTHNATVGRVALMPDNCGEIILGTSVTYYRLNPEFIDPNYCCYTMQEQFWQSQLWAIMEQTTRNQVSISKQAEFYFPLPPLAEQHEIVRRVGLLFERADAFDQEVAAASRRCERLTQAVLGKAFRGELVTAGMAEFTAI
jgi:type I restriction enzyme S subunit